VERPVPVDMLLLLTQPAGPWQGGGTRRSEPRQDWTSLSGGHRADFRKPRFA
jgi:hypothetical protein